MIFSPFGFRNQEVGGVAPTPTPTPTPTPSIPTSGLTLYFDAGNASSYPGTGSTWYDLSTNALSAPLGFGTYYDSADGGAMVFDGVDDQCPSQGNWTGQPSGNSTYTYIVFFNPTTAVRRNGLFYSGGSSTSKQRSGIRTNQSSESGSTGGFTNEWNGNLYSTTTSLLNNTWYQFAVTYDQSNRLGYKNGSSAGFTSLASSGLNILDPENGSIGISKSGTSSYYMYGKISVVMVYNRVLSSTEISDIWDYFKGRYGY